MPDDPARPTDGAAIEDVYLEERRFEPPAAFAAEANYPDPSIYEKAVADPEAFWAEQAASLDWFSPWDKVLEWELPFARWFTGGTLNVSYNCLDRHVAAGLGDRVAFHWEGEPGDKRTISYADLPSEVECFANVLKSLGVRRGDVVAIYMPLIPELPVAMLACTRVGAAHSIVFGGFSPDALRDRINDASAKVLVTADGGWRRGQAVALKVNADVARGEELRGHVAQHIGPIARPKTVIFTDELPKTRSGKIMRRLLRDVAEGRDLGDTTTLADQRVVDQIREMAAARPTED